MVPRTSSGTIELGCRVEKPPGSLANGLIAWNLGSVQRRRRRGSHRREGSCPLPLWEITRRRVLALLTAHAQPSLLIPAHKAVCKICSFRFPTCELFDDFWTLVTLNPLLPASSTLMDSPPSHTPPLKPPSFRSLYSISPTPRMAYPGPQQSEMSEKHELFDVSPATTPSSVPGKPLPSWPGSKQPSLRSQSSAAATVPTGETRIQLALDYGTTFTGKLSF